MTLRPFRPEDLPAVLRLFRETVHTVNRADYSEAQVNAWAPAEPDQERWRAKLASEEAIVAKLDGEIVGFCSWTAEGCLDFLYVHHAHQRKGIATALYQAAEQTLKSKALARIHTQASTTAQPFFTRQGFQTVRHQTVKANGVPMPNAVMEKPLP